MLPLPKEIWTDVINLYKNMPFLWDKKDPKYSNRSVRESGYNIILKKYQEYDRNADLHIIKKKIDNMRTSYRRELKKVVASKQCRSDTEDVYVPELWYFDMLTFLDDHIVMQRHARDSSIDSSDDEDNDNSQASENYLYTEHKYNTEDIYEEQLDFINTDETPRKRRRKIEQGEIVEDIINGHNSSMMANKEEDWMVTGKSIGIQLKGLDSHQSAIAQKLISDALFYAKMGKLTEDSFISVNDSQVTHLIEDY